MARKIFGPRKQRTREHVIADQSVNHVKRFIIDEGHAAQRIEETTVTICSCSPSTSRAALNRIQYGFK